MVQSLNARQYVLPHLQFFLDGYFFGHLTAPVTCNELLFEHLLGRGLSAVKLKLEHTETVHPFPLIRIITPI